MSQSTNLIVAAYSAIVTAALVVSCVADKGLPKKTPTPHIENAQHNTTQVAQGVTKVADSIDHHVSDVRKDTPASVLPKIEPHLTGINEDTGDLRNLRGVLDATLVELASAKDAGTKIEKDNSKLVAENQKLIEEKKNETHKAMMQLTILSVIGLGISAALIYTGNKIGIATGVGSAVTLSCAVVVAKYTFLFGIGAGVLLFIGLGVLVYELWSRKKIAMELVQSGEIPKLTMRANARHYIYGNGPIPGKVDAVQSPRTKKFVAKLRAKKQMRLAPSATSSANLSVTA